MDTNIRRDIPVHRGSQFTWFKGQKGHVGCIEASDLGGHSWSGLVYNDACDEGFYIRSHKTGDLKLFVLSKTIREPDGDISGWTYAPVDGSNIEIHVEND